MVGEKMEDERVELEVSLPKKLLDRVKRDEEVPSEYIEDLIREDYGLDEPDTSKGEEDEKMLSAMEKEKRRQDTINEAMLEFMKKYREEEWIQYMLESRGEEAIEEEARRIVEKNPEEWSEFLRDFSEA